ncbi:putative transmembrane protein [Thalictrum thalictroides]|uniref:Putative transmembrane protein n=1 Tax=Thalictrum thalictroides TaxID=46969 RepID=A0A7J6V9H8_THATH|nr:putative transmembrane protein [Thalictrum thalictroides]
MKPNMRHNHTSSLNPIPKSVRKLWDVWDLRVFVLFSLFLQILLILFSSLRKRNASKWIITFIWLAYLLADWVAAFALGLIANSKGDTPSSAKNKDLLAFWAPFLLLHLGGPDTITAFSLEDNELWIRHLLGLLFQFMAAVYIFLQSLPYNELWLPTLFMFLAGLFKYAERTRALYLASMSIFKDSMLKEPDPGPNYAKLMAEYQSMNEANLPAEIKIMKEPETYIDLVNFKSTTEETPVEEIDDIAMVQSAYEFFQIFKGLIVDLIFSFHDRNKSRDFFLKRNTEDAFTVIAIELNFMYEVLYTKAAVIHSCMGYFLRLICSSSILIALLLFIFSYKKKHDFDTNVTYLLLFGAVTLDFIALFMLIFSDWSIALIKSSNVKSMLYRTLTKIPFLNTSRWSASVSQFNLIAFCLSRRPKPVERFIDYWGLKDFLNEIQYKYSEPLKPWLKDFLFNELKAKSKDAKDAKTAREICSSRGDGVLGQSIYYKSLGWSVEVEYDESLILWHIATEIVYHTCDEENNNNNNNNDRELAKVISDYMLYLLVMQPTMMSAIAGIGQIRFRDTCAEAEKFFSGSGLEPSKFNPMRILCILELETEKSKRACYKLIGVNTKIKPIDVKGDRSKSVLFDAVRLANDLRKLKTEKRWKLMSQVWLELLCYAATHCRARSHAQPLSKGGELVTFVWLLMTHLGLGEQFLIEAGHARAKIIVDKNDTSDVELQHSKIIDDNASKDKQNLGI